MRSISGSIERKEKSSFRYFFEFSFCFKQDGLILAPILLNDSEIDVIDLTPFLSYRSKQLKSMMNDENQDPTNILAENNELKPLNLAERERISLEKYKLEIEQRVEKKFNEFFSNWIVVFSFFQKYFEELLQHRDREVQQMKIRYETLKGERESEIIQMENIILELQRELFVEKLEKIRLEFRFFFRLDERHETKSK